MIKSQHQSSSVDKHNKNKSSRENYRDPQKDNLMPNINNAADIYRNEMALNQSKRTSKNRDGKMSTKGGGKQSAKNFN